MLSEQYPGSTGGAAGPDIGYAYDTMGRLNTMTDLVAQASIISATTYDPANRLLAMTGSLNETRTYNVMGQLTNLVNNSVNMTYSFSATQNNGKITGQTDNISGEQVVYAYDALNRLASAGATSNSWGQSYAYDGFGNLTNQTVTAGTAPSLSVTYNASTNRQSGDCADANGNINSVSVCGTFTGYGYDVSNRIVSVPGGTQYAYAPGNKRIWRGTTTYNQGNGTYSLTLDELTFWSVSGKKLATYNVSGDPNVIYDSGTPPQLTVTLATSNYYFGRKLIAKNTNPASPTYVGSDRLGSFGKFYPWGQEKPSATQNGTEKFTGYFRDAETGNDYAINRYHQPGMGRFLSGDPQGSSARLKSPNSWNRYAYTGGNPVNRTDPIGLDTGCTLDGVDVDCECLPSTAVSRARGPATPALFVSTGCLAGDDDDDDDDDDDSQVSCLDNFTNSQISYVDNNYADANELSDLSGVESYIILGWGALESGWGSKGIVTTNDNYFGWRGAGNVKCSNHKWLLHTFGCFSGFFTSGLTALLSTNNYFKWDGQVGGVSVATILNDEFEAGATIAQAFDALAYVAGYTGDPGYGNAVSARANAVLNIEGCLESLGMIP